MRGTGVKKHPFQLNRCDAVRYGFLLNRFTDLFHIVIMVDSDS